MEWEKVPRTFTIYNNLHQYLHSKTEFVWELFTVYIWKWPMNKKKFHKYCLRISAVISTSQNRNLCDRFMLFACAWDLWVEQFYRGFRYFMAFEVKEEKINTKILNNIFIHKIHHSLLNSSQEIYDFLYDFGKFRNFENVYDVAYEQQFQLDTCFSWYFRELETKID